MHDCLMICHIQSLLLGLLGSITQTADSDDCPGKCIHAIASLICDEVIESVRQVHIAYITILQLLIKRLANTWGDMFVLAAVNLRLGDVFVVGKCEFCIQFAVR